jgi:methanogenic corrinoid protein MtbC1
MESLRVGDQAGSRQVVMNLYLGGHSAVDICDEVIAPTFHAIGDAWCEGVVQVYQERRACEICMSILREMVSIMPPPREDAPYAIGGTLWDDPYTLPNAMVELALREAGWRAESHGIGNPAGTLAAAIRDRRPDLFWLSVSTLHDEETWLKEYAIIAKAAEEPRVSVAVGGRALTPERRQRMTYAAYCDTLRHLIGFVQAVKG